MESRTISIWSRCHSPRSYNDETFRWYLSLCRSFCYYYIITASCFYTEYLIKCSFVYSFDALTYCNHLRDVTPSVQPSVSITKSSVTSITILYHTLIKFSSIFYLNSVLLIYTPDPDYCVSPFPMAPILDITWVLFDSAVNSLALVFLNQGCHSLQHFICESIDLNFSLTNIVSFGNSISFTKFHHTLSSLQHQLSLSSTSPFFHSDIELKQSES